MYTRRRRRDIIITISFKNLAKYTHTYIGCWCDVRVLKLLYGLGEWSELIRMVEGRGRRGREGGGDGRRSLFMRAFFSKGRWMSVALCLIRLVLTPRGAAGPVQL